MPIYEFQCKDCNKEFEELVMRKNETIECPVCHSNKTKRLLSGFAVTGESRLSGSDHNCSSCKPSHGKCGSCSCH